VTRTRTLLCVANYGAGFGYAHHVFDVLYAGVADRLSADGVRTLVAYPTLEGPPAGLAGSAAQAVALDASLRDHPASHELTDFIRRENVQTVFCIDHAFAESWWYAPLRAAGVRTIVVYNQTSGTGYTARGVKRALKWIGARLPLVTADTLVCASGFVARREIARMCIPKQRIVVVHNGVDLPPEAATGPPLHERLGLPPSRPIVFASCRAVPAKGVDILFRAFDLAHGAYQDKQLAPLLVFVGDGEQMSDLKTLRQSLASADSITMTGYRTDAPALAAGADVCVIPSVWDDAFPIAVLEAMAQGRAVIASRVGGIPEAINSDAVGLLVPPRDERALAQAIRTLLDDPARRATMGRAARARIAASLSKDAQVSAITAILRPRLVD
jgi:glycosyltransferase involved in cell wall biosynthesis